MLPVPLTLVLSATEVADCDSEGRRSLLRGNADVVRHEIHAAPAGSARLERCYQCRHRTCHQHDVFCGREHFVLFVCRPKQVELL